MEAYKELHMGILLLRNFQPEIVTVDFEIAHINVK
jgi:hypothetical protein